MLMVIALLYSNRASLVTKEEEEKDYNSYSERGV